MSLVNPDERPETPATLPPRPVPMGPAPAVAATDAGSRAESLNLARRPFGNSRPVVRVSLILWLLGLALLLGNVSLFWSYLSSSADKRAQIAQGDEEIQKVRQNADQLQRRLNGYDLPQQNDQTDFLNTQIDARTFSWSLLLDRLAEVLPNDVRLNRLVPLTAAKSALPGQRGRGVRRSPAREGEVQLTISGEARNDDAPLQFVDNLLRHPAFLYANILRESRGDEGSNVTKFDLTVTYLPGGPPHSAVVEESPAGTPATAPAGKPAPAATPAAGGRP